MADTPEQDSDDSKLALPKMSLRRRKRDPAPVEEAPAEEPAADEAPTEVIAQQEAAPEPERPDIFDDAPDDAPDDEPADDEDRPTEIFAAAPERPADHEPEPAAAPDVRRERAMPHVDPRAGAVFAGLVAGLVGVGLTYGFGRACEALRSSGSCGGVGVLLLIVVLVAMSFVGSALLRAFRIPDSLSTSFLGVGIVAVIVLLFLLGSIDRWYMVVVIPLIAAVGFLLSWWGTSKFGATDEPAPYVKARDKVEQD
ncbi:MAG: hypothetical protein JWO46_3013 [Nocardioidaceae bacterium]|nr:hypothetical protein [Nocardioidaceae bacterium]